MPKRFTDTDKWKKPFIRGLEGAYKLLWFYILDDCDHAGIWQVDFEVACIRIGEEVDRATALLVFGERIDAFEETKWWIPDFVSFQYGELSDKNRLHVSVMQILSKHKVGPYKPLTRGQGQGQGTRQGKEQEQGKADEIIFPFNSDAFKTSWGGWITYRNQIKKPYRSAMSQQAALKKLSEHSESDAIAMIENSIANQWQGIFELDKNKNGKQKGITAQGTLDRLNSYTN
jgi:hypothetical protein